MNAQIQHNTSSPALPANLKRRFQYEPLTSEDLDRVHATAMRVFDEVGFEIQEPQALDLFRKAGARIDAGGNIARMTEQQIMDILSTTPHTLTLFSRDANHHVTLGAGNVYFGTGGTALNILDYPSQEQRLAALSDLIDIARLVDKLDNIHLLLLPTYPNEIAVDHVDVNRFLTGMLFTRKHIMGGIYTARGIDDVMNMAAMLAGSAEKLRREPFISMIACGISPLRLDSKYGAYMIQLARHGIPTAVPVEPLCGATAPVTLAGTLVIQTCDGLINMMLMQLANPGAPAIYGSVATSVNLHDVAYLGGPVESGMLNAATAQIARYYGFPYYSTAGISDAKILDTQCGYETGITNLLVGLGGGDFIHDAAGLMEFASTVSREKLVMDNDILGMVSRAIKGIDVNDKTLAFDVIQRAGPGGNFVSERHTRRYMNREHYHPTIANRQRREAWTADGCKSAARTAHEKACAILDQEPIYYIDETIRNRIRESFPNVKEELFTV